MLGFGNSFASGFRSPEDVSLGLLIKSSAFLLSCQNIAFVFGVEVYVYIGITSLCLYNITGFPIFQDGILYKVHSPFLYKIQKSLNSAHFPLTAAAMV